MALNSGYLSISSTITSGESMLKNVSHASNLSVIPLLCILSRKMSSGRNIYFDNLKDLSFVVSIFSFSWYTDYTCKSKTTQKE